MSWTAILAALQSLLAQPWAQNLEHEFLLWLLAKLGPGGMVADHNHLQSLVAEFKGIKGLAH